MVLVLDARSRVRFVAMCGALAFGGANDVARADAPSPPIDAPPPPADAGPPDVASPPVSEGDGDIDHEESEADDSDPEDIGRDEVIDREVVDREEVTDQEVVDREDVIDQEAIDQEAIDRDDADRDVVEGEVRGSEDEEPGEGDDDELPMFGARATVDVAVPPPLPAAASEVAIDTSRYRLVPRQSAESLLTLAPGVFLVNHSGAFHASTMLLRGFVAGEGQDVEILVDGQPINEPSNAHGHGYADTHFVIPEMVGGLRVTEGPFSPWQGDYAVAGSAEYELGPSERGVTVRGEYGSFDRTRLLLAWAPVNASRGTFVALDLRRTNGFGVQRAAESASLNGRYETEVARGVHFSLFAAGQTASFASAGVVRADDVALGRLPCGPSADAQFFCSPDPEQGGSSARALLNAGLSIRQSGLAWDNHLFAGYRRLRIRENFTGIALDPIGDGLDEQYETVSVGLRGRARFATRFFDQPQVFELGYILREDVGTTRLVRLRADGGIPYRALFDDDIAITQIGAHVGTELRLLDWLALRAGVRADAFGLSATEKNFPDEDRMGPRLTSDATDAWGLAIAPRGSVQIALAPWLTWQTSVGVGTRSSDATALSTGEAAPFARVIASETGLVVDHEDGDLHLDARALAYHTHVDRDLVFDAQRGRNVDVGASSRLGALGAISLGVARYLDASVSFAWSEAFLLPDRGFAFTSSVRLPYVPRWVGRADVVGRYPIAIDGETVELALGVGAGLLGERPLPLGQSADPVFLLDAQVSAGWRGLEVRVAFTNVTDARWQSAVFRYASHWDPSTPASRVPELHFAAGSPFALDVSVGLRFDESRGPFASPDAQPASAETASGDAP